jgi:hypothetical protein
MRDDLARAMSLVDLARFMAPAKFLAQPPLLNVHRESRPDRYVTLLGVNQTVNGWLFLESKPGAPFEVGTYAAFDQ